MRALVLALLTPVMDRVRACKALVPDTEQTEEEKETSEPSDEAPTFRSILSDEAGFNEVWDQLTDMEFVLLHKCDKNARLIDVAKLIPLTSGFLVVERLNNKLEYFPKEKRIWKNAKDVAITIIQVMITRCMVVPNCSGQVLSTLYWMCCALVRSVAPPKIARAVATLCAPASSARHLHTFANAVSTQQSKLSRDLKPYVVELYVRAITTGMNELEKLKLKPEFEEKEARATEYTLASWFMQLGHLLSASARMKCECILTAFSVHPTPALYERIKQAPVLTARPFAETQPKEEPEVKSEFGSWANDSRTQTNFVKTSEHLKMQATQHQANVLSTTVLNEGEVLGLDAELCQDIIVLLSGPRVKTLSWDMDRQALLDSCKAHMERTQFGTRTLTTELKYLNLDVTQYQHLPEEEEDENDVYYGIEKGYEHLVEIEPAPEEIWEDAYDPERTNSATSDYENEVTKHKKKKGKSMSSESESDPLSLFAEKKEKKKERAHGKEKSKEHKKKKGDKIDKDKEKVNIIFTHSKLKAKEGAEKKDDSKKKEKKERKKREKKEKRQNPSAIKSSLVGMRVSKVELDEANQNVPNSDHDSQDKEGIDDEKARIDKFEQNTKKNSQLSAARQRAINAIQKSQMTYVNHIPPGNKLNEASSSHNTPNMSKSKGTIRDEVKKSISKLLQFRKHKLTDASSSASSSPQQPSTSRAPTPLSPLIGTKVAHTNLVLKEQQNDQLNTMKSEAKSFKAIFYPSYQTDRSCSRMLAYSRKNPRSASEMLSRSNESLNMSSLNNALNQTVGTNQQNLSDLRSATQITPKRTDTTHLSSYQKFLQDLQENARDDVITTISKPIPEPKQKPPPISKAPKKKEMKPMSRVNPVTPNIKTESENAITRVNNGNIEPRVYQPIHAVAKQESLLRTGSNQNVTEDSLIKNEQGMSQAMQIVRTQKTVTQTEPRILHTMTKPVNMTINEPRLNQVIHTLAKQEPMISPQSAKPLQPKKVDVAPNTFARLSYEKNKSKHNEKNKQQSDNLHNDISDEIDRRIADLRLAKAVQINIDHSLPVCRAVNATQSKPKVSSKVEVQKIEPITSGKAVNQQHPVLTNILKHNTVTVVGTTDAHKPRTAVQPKNSVVQPTKTITHPKSPQPKDSALTEEDQQDLLRLLGQKNVLSRPHIKINWANNQQNLNNSNSTTAANNFSMDTVPVLSNNSITLTPVSVQNQTLTTRKPTNVKDQAVTIENKRPQVSDGMGFNFPVISNTTIMKTTAMVQNKPPKERKTKQKVAKDFNALYPDIQVNKNQRNSKEYVPKPPVIVHKYNDDREDQDWQKVLNAIRAQKTPSRGPNALDILLNKDSFEKVNERNQKINSPNTTLKTSPPLMPSTSSESVHVIKQSVIKKHTAQMPKLQNAIEAKKLTLPNPVKLYPEVTKRSQPQELHKDPFISGIPNTDHEILEELMDDDLRQEIEGFSDEDSYCTPDMSAAKTSKNIQVKNEIVGKKVKKLDFLKHPKHNVLNTPTSSEVPTNVKAKPQIISNEKVDIRFKNLVGSKIIRQEPTTMASKIQSGIIYNVNNTMALTNVTSTITPSTLYNAAPTSSVPNLLIVNPYGTTCNVNQSYVCANSIPNVIYQQATPDQIIIRRHCISNVITPAATINIAFNNTIQAVQCDVPVLHMPETLGPTIPVQTIPIPTIPNITEPFVLSNVEPVNKMDIKSKLNDHNLGPEIVSQIATKHSIDPKILPNSNDALKITANKFLSEDQENIKTEDKRSKKEKFNTKASEKIDPASNKKQKSTLESKVNNKALKDQERLIIKRLSIINRNINSRCSHQAIALPYTPLSELQPSRKTYKKQNEDELSNKKQNEVELCNNIITTVKTNLNSCYEEENISSCRSILLTSSNKLETDSIISKSKDMVQTPEENEINVSENSKKQEGKTNDSVVYAEKHTESKINYLEKKLDVVAKRVTKNMKAKKPTKKTVTSKVKPKSAAAILKQVKNNKPVNVSHDARNIGTKLYENVISTTLFDTEGALGRSVIRDEKETPNKMLPIDKTIKLEIKSDKVLRKNTKNIVSEDPSGVKNIFSAQKINEENSFNEQKVKISDDSIGKVVAAARNTDWKDESPKTKQEDKKPTEEIVKAKEVNEVKSVITHSGFSVEKTSAHNWDIIKPTSIKNTPVSHKFDKLVDDIESAICAITESAVSSPILEEPLFDMIVDEDVSEVEKIKETNMSQLKIITPYSKTLTNKVPPTKDKVYVPKNKASDKTSTDKKIDAKCLLPIATRDKTAKKQKCIKTKDLWQNVSMLDKTNEKRITEVITIDDDTESSEILQETGKEHNGKSSSSMDQEQLLSKMKYPENDNVVPQEANVKLINIPVGDQPLLESNIVDKNKNEIMLSSETEADICKPLDTDTVMSVDDRPFLKSIIGDNEKDVISLSSKSDADKNKTTEINKLVENGEPVTRADDTNLVQQVVPQSYKDSIKIEDLPIPGNKNPLKRCVRIILPNNKSYKATLSGQVVSVDSFFEDPALRKILLSGLSDKKMYLNIHQVSTKIDHKIVETQVHGIDIRQTPENRVPVNTSDIVNLVSDDDEEEETYQIIKVKSGSLKVKNIEKETFDKHKEKLNQTCSIPLQRCDQKRKAEVFVQALLEDLAHTKPLSTEVIEIDDSSDEESSKEHTGIDVLKDILLQELGVAQNKATKKPRYDVENTDLLMKELSVAQDNAAIELQSDVQTTAISERPSRTRKSKYHRQRDSRTVSVEPMKRSLSQPKISANLTTTISANSTTTDLSFGKDSYSKVITRNCFIKLTNCDRLVKKMCRIAKSQDDKIRIDDEVTIYSSDDDLPLISRSGSYSILNELDTLVEPLSRSDRESSPVMRVFETMYALDRPHNLGRNSPVMEAFDMIVVATQPRSRVSSELHQTPEYYVCKSDWFESKRSAHLQNVSDKTRTIDEICKENVQNELDISAGSETDAATDLSNAGPENVHRLTTIMSKYFEDNPIIYHINYSVNNNDISKTPLKRKLHDSDHTASNKVIKTFHHRTIIDMEGIDKNCDLKEKDKIDSKPKFLTGEDISSVTKWADTTILLSNTSPQVNLLSLVQKSPLLEIISSDGRGIESKDTIILPKDTPSQPNSASLARTSHQDSIIESKDKIVLLTCISTKSNSLALEETSKEGHVIDSEDTTILPSDIPSQPNSPSLVETSHRYRFIELEDTTIQPTDITSQLESPSMKETNHGCRVIESEDTTILPIDTPSELNSPSLGGTSHQDSVIESEDTIILPTDMSSQPNSQYFEETSIEAHVLEPKHTTILTTDALPEPMSPSLVEQSNQDHVIKSDDTNTLPTATKFQHSSLLVETEKHDKVMEMEDTIILLRHKAYLPKSHSLVITSSQNHVIEQENTTLLSTDLASQPNSPSLVESNNQSRVIESESIVNQLTDTLSQPCSPSLVEPSDVLIHENHDIGQSADDESVKNGCTNECNQDTEEKSSLETKRTRENIVEITDIIVSDIQINCCGSDGKSEDKPVEEIRHIQDPVLVTKNNDMDKTGSDTQDLTESDACKAESFKVPDVEEKLKNVKTHTTAKSSLPTVEINNTSSVHMEIVSELNRAGQYGTAPGPQEIMGHGEIKEEDVIFKNLLLLEESAKQAMDDSGETFVPSDYEEENIKENQHLDKDYLSPDSLRNDVNKSQKEILSVAEVKNQECNKPQTDSDMPTLNTNAIISESAEDCIVKTTKAIVGTYKAEAYDSNVKPKFSRYSISYPFTVKDYSFDVNKSKAKDDALIFKDEIKGNVKTDTDNISIEHSLSLLADKTSKVSLKADNENVNYGYVSNALDKIQDECNESNTISEVLSVPDQPQLVPAELISDKVIVAEKIIEEEVNCDENLYENNATLVYKDDSGMILKGIEYEDPEMGTCYVFPLAKTSDGGINEVLNSSVESTIEVIQMLNVSTEEDDTESLSELDLQVLKPNVVYSKHSFKRKSNMSDVTCSAKRSKRNSRSRDSYEIKFTEKKYRKSKNIDAPKLSATAIADSSNVKDFKRRLDYYSTVGFSYSITFSTEFINPSEQLCNWPISGPLNSKIEENYIDQALFKDLDNEDKTIRDPFQQTLSEEITAKYNDADYPNSQTEETNFNMGFVDNSPHDDSQPEIKTEYTELTTADLNLPMVDDYVRRNQALPAISQNSTNMTINCENIPIETELVKSEVKIELEEESLDDKERESDEHSQANKHLNNVDYSYNTNNSTPSANSEFQALFNSDKQGSQDTVEPQKAQNGSPEKSDQIAHAMNAAGIITSAAAASTRAQALVNILTQKLRQGAMASTPNAANTYSKTTTINAMSLQQALASILPPPLNQTGSTENNQQGQSSVTPQVLHIVQGKNCAGNQITLVDNNHQSVITTPNATPVLHIVQNKVATPGQNSNTSAAPHSNTFSGLSLVDAGLQQGGNQLLHIVNTGNQKNNNAGQLLKRVNLLTNIANMQGSNEQKMVQFVCKSADGKSIQLNAPHQRSMVLRLQPIETPNVQHATPKPAETNQALSPAQGVNSSTNKDSSINQQEIKSRSVYEENYAKFIQNSSNKPTLLEKSNSLPKFNQAFGKAVFQDGNQKQNEINTTSLPTNTGSSNCSATENSINLDHIGQISSPPLLIRKSPAIQTTQAPPNLVQQIKHTIAPMNIQTMHGGVIYTRQIPVNIGGGQTINLITVPSTELIDESGQKQKSNQRETIEPSIIKIVPQSQPPSNAEVSDEMNNDNAQQGTPQPQPVLTQMRIKLPMLSKTPHMVSGTRVVRPSFFQIQRNVIGGANQVYQQLVLTAAPPLGQQTIRLPQGQTRQIKVPENQSSSESQMSTSTLEQLREFDMVLEQVKERSTVQPNSNSGSNFKLHTSTTDTTDSPVTATSTSVEMTQVLYSIGSNQPLNVTYVNRKPSVSTPTTSTFVRSPDSSGIADSPTSSSHSHNLPHTSTSEASSSETSTHKTVKVSSKSKSRPKSSSHAPHAMKLNSVPPKTTTQKPLEDEQTTQRILYILAEYKEQVENSPDKDKPAPRRRSNPPSNPSGSSKRKKSSSGSRRSGRDSSPIHGEDSCRTMGSEDSSCGTSQGDCNESCMDSRSPQDSPRKVARKLAFEQDPPTPTQARPQQQRNVIVAEGQTIAVARGAPGKPTTTVLMPTNYILPVSMVKGGQQIAIVTNRGPKLLTVGGGEGGATNALLLQRLIGPAGLKPMLTRPGVRHVRLPTAALHNLQAFNLASATNIQPPDSTASPAPDPPKDVMNTNRSNQSPWANRDSEVKPDRPSSPDESEPWNLPSSADPNDYPYEETVRADNMDRTVLDPIQDRYSPDMEAQRIFDKMFDVDTKKSYIVDSPRCGYDIDASDCDDKSYQVVHKKDSHRQSRLSHVSAAALRHKYAILEHELRLQKSLSEECEDLGVDSPSASELFPEAELLFAASPAQDHGPDTPQHSHTPQPILNHSVIQPDIDDQIATDQLLPRHQPTEDRPELDVNLGLEDVGIVTVRGDGSATIALDQEEFARAHPNTTFHSEPTDEGVVHPFTMSNLKSRHITSTIFHSHRAPATVLMTAPQATVISQAAPETSNPVKYSEIDNMIHNIPSTHTNNINLASVLVKDDGLTRFDNILTDSRELHLSHTASAIVHPSGNATQVIRRVCYDDKRGRDFLMDEPDALIAGDDAKMVAEDSSRDATLESMGEDVDDDNSSPERQGELFWESNSASERSESRRPMEFSSDSEKCCKSPSFDETNSTDSSGVGSHMRLDSVIKEARGIERSGSADGSSADDAHPPLRTYPPKRLYHSIEGEMERSLSGKTRAGERSPDLEVRRRASGRGVVKRGCHCCNGSPAPTPPRPKKPRQRKPTDNT
ncbi:hypothetical protein O0L34_g13148 [Tuta absoluta]|nr:hypothetical protein O0L34_g13148 [Tuta absoluta]